MGWDENVNKDHTAAQLHHFSPHKYQINVKKMWKYCPDKVKGDFLYSNL
jgi:hypothetical protein